MHDHSPVPMHQAALNLNSPAPAEVLQRKHPGQLHLIRIKLYRKHTASGIG